MMMRAGLIDGRPSAKRDWLSFRIVAWKRQLMVNWTYIFEIRFRYVRGAFQTPIAACQIVVSGSTKSAAKASAMP